MLKTLYALRKIVQERVGWRIAAEMLIAAAQGQRPVIFAEIAVRQALHADEPASPIASGTSTACGRPALSGIMDQSNRTECACLSSPSIET